MKLVHAEQVIIQENTIIPFSLRPQYPDFRFHCPNCGSLEVLVDWKSSNIPLKGKCLDCTKSWFEGIITR